jgi:PAS domain S-box-containing protein
VAIPFVASPRAARLQEDPLSSSSHDESPMLFEHDVATGRWSWSPGLKQLHGLAPDAVPTTELLLAHVVEEEREGMRQRLSEYAAKPGSYSCTVQMRDSHGALRRVRYVCQSEAGGGEVKRLLGFVIDITGMMRDHANQAVEGAVEHRAAIEQAKGALMVSFGIDEVAAFELLRGYSSRANTKLVQVAEHIVNGVSSDRFSREEPVRSLLDILLALDPSSPPAGLRRGDD